MSQPKCEKCGKFVSKGADTDLCGVCITCQAKEEILPSVEEAHGQHLELLGLTGEPPKTTKTPIFHTWPKMTGEDISKITALKNAAFAKKAKKCGEDGPWLAGVMDKRADDDDALLKTWPGAAETVLLVGDRWLGDVSEMPTRMGLPV